MYGDVAVEIAGINHMAWVTKITKDGRDIYPRFKEDVYRQHEEGPRPDEVVFNFGSTRVDMMRRVGYMVTESSEHFAEYVPYYLRTEELIRKYDIPIDKYKWYNQIKEEEYSKMLHQAAENRLPEAAQSVEYCAGILAAMVTNVPYKIYANVMNTGLITNLPPFACVETACFVDTQGVHPCVYGDLPQQLVPMCSMEVNVHKLASDAVKYNDRDYVYWAMMADPVAHTVLDLDQMKSLTDELLEAQSEYLDGYFIV
jgi:alpha-galactosidase